MAKAQKKVAKKTSKTAPKKKAPPRGRAPAVALSAEQRRKLLKPRESYDDLVDAIVRAWKSERALRVPGLTSARLAKLLRDAERASGREEEARLALERKLAPLTDRRLGSEDALWRAVLDVNAAVKLYARTDEALAERFQFLTQALTSARSAPPEPTTA